MGFVHIHNHTEYSLLDGANRIPQMVARAKELGMPALAITDHGVMFGVMEFYYECRKQGVKPLIGMEAYVAPNGRHVKTGREENQTFHLLLLARNLEGYRNLCKLHTVAALEGFYHKPRIDHELLKDHAKGLIGTSACLGSEVCRQLMAGDYDRAQWLAGMYKEIFDEGCFFIELQDHGLREQREIAGSLARIAKELSLPLVATNDAHYLCKGDATAHDVLLCIGTGALVSDARRLRFETEEFYLKSEEEMRALFPDHPEAIENTLLVAEMCDLELGKQRALMPQPNLPEGVESADHLRRLAEQGLRERIANPDRHAWERLNYELGVIKECGFDDYFLLVLEFAQFTRDQRIAYGVRGSAAGSLVSYCVGITDVDPLHYDLTFERFLNPERVSMPDIDMDFQDDRRDEVIQYVSERFGTERTAQIVTFGTLGAKAALRDAARVMGYAPSEADRLCKTIPGVPVGITLEQAEHTLPEFVQMVRGEPKLARLVEVAKSIEGLARHPGVHAAGVVISRDPLAEHIPLYRGNEGQPVTAFEMGILEKIGLLKMDFLGLSNLTVLARTVEHIRRRRGEEVDLQRIPLDDQKTFDMLSRGETVGVFQLESAGMRRAIVELKPNSVKELAAMVALYRPGPMEHIARFVDNKFGRALPEYLDERMRPILEETYGVIVYQDQVLKLVQALAGFSLGKADVLRRAMGKKDKVAMAEMKEEFRAGAEANGLSAKTVEQIWELLLPFAGYAFNKAHAVCYALIAYQTAYLKARYPVEYMAGLLEVYRGSGDRVTAFIEECRRQKIPVLPPDVNRSGVNFTIEDTPKNGQAIRFGLAAIKGVGENLVQAMIEEREGAGPYTHLFEFCERMKPHGITRTALEPLVRAGALDGIEPNRSKLLAVLDAALLFGDQAYRNQQAGQDSLFGDAAPELNLGYPMLPDAPALSRAEILAMEKDVMGIYVSDHPLRGYERALRRTATHSCAAVAELEDGETVKLAGVVAAARPITTKNGNRMLAVTLEDLTGQVSCMVFAAKLDKLAPVLAKDSVVEVGGRVSLRERPGSKGEKTLEVAIFDAAPLPPPSGPAGETDEASPGTLVIKLERATRSQLQGLRQTIERHPGDFMVEIHLGSGERSLMIEPLRRVAYTKEFEQALRKTTPTGRLFAVLNGADPLETMPAASETALQV